MKRKRDSARERTFVPELRFSQRAKPMRILPEVIPFGLLIKIEPVLLKKLAFT
jgi:hypothetical protein